MAKRKKTLLYDLDWLRKQIEEGYSYTEIGRLAKITGKASYQRVYNKIRAIRKDDPSFPEPIRKKKYPRLDDLTWMIEQIQEKKSTQEIRKLAGNPCLAYVNRAQAAARKKAKQEGIYLPIIDRREYCKYPLLKDKKWLYKKRFEEGLAYREIAIEAGGCSHERVRQILLDLNWDGWINYVEITDQQLREAVERYKDGVSCTKISQSYGVGSSRLASDIKKYVGFDESEPLPKLRYPMLYDDQWVKDRYLKDQWSLEMFSKEFGCSALFVRNRLKKLGIKIRNVSESQRNRRYRSGISPKRYNKKYIQQRLDAGATKSEIAREFSISPSCMQSWCKKHISQDCTKKNVHLRSYLPNELLDQQ